MHTFMFLGKSLKLGVIAYINYALENKLFDEFVI